MCPKPPGDNQRSHQFRNLEQDIVSCQLCPRLRAHCERVAVTKRAAYRDQEYWGKPVPGFGDPSARLVLVGLAPGTHGANRTGRVFTGDRSGDWLYEALHRYGFANRAESVSASDGMVLRGAYVTSACRCAPPGNRPSAEELGNCRSFLEREFDLAASARVYLGLGLVGFRAILDVLSRRGCSIPRPRPKFGHRVRINLEGGRSVLASYHPSQQNTQTGRLTREMFHSVFEEARRILDNPVPAARRAGK